MLNSVRLGSYTVQNGKTSCGYGTPLRSHIVLKNKNNVRMEFSSTENADLRSFWAFLPLKMLKKGTA